MAAPILCKYFCSVLFVVSCLIQFQINALFHHAMRCTLNHRDAVRAVFLGIVYV
jgi:hypothetical protein